jgi:hypothetical protein
MDEIDAPTANQEETFGSIRHHEPGSIYQQNRLQPPVHGAEMHTCENGANTGCRYWVVRQKDKYNQYKSVFFQWIDIPKSDLGSRIDRLELTVKNLASAVDKLLLSIQRDVRQ